MSAAFSQGARRLIKRRASGRCERCGKPETRGQCHHRHARQMGGSLDDRLGLPSNGLYLCDQCHREVESHRTRSEFYGWLVRTGRVVSEQPVRMFDGWFYLNDDGSISRIELQGGGQIGEGPAQ